MVRSVAPATMPGGDFRHAAELVEPELAPPHVGALPELPARGHHGTQLGRAVAQLRELHAEITSYGWRLVPRPGADHQRCTALLTSDVNTLADIRGAKEEAGGVLGPLHLEVLGPVSLAARLHLPNGEKALIDHGARRDLTDSLASGLVDHIQHVRRSVGPQSVSVVLQEPEYSAVRAGAVPTVSGYRTIRALGRDETRSMFRAVVDALRGSGVDEVIFDCGELVAAEHVEDFFSRRETTADGFAMPVHRADAADWERTAELVEAGASIWAGLLRPRTSGTSSKLPEVSQLAGRLTEPWQRLGMSASSLSSFTVVGHGTADRSALGEFSDSEFLRTWSRLRDTADALTDQMEA